MGLAAIIEKTDLDFNIKVLFGLVFSLTLPIGIILGMNVSSGDLLSEGGFQFNFHNSTWFTTYYSISIADSI